jgi:hypothetical protein
VHEANAFAHHRAYLAAAAVALFVSLIGMAACRQGRPIIDTTPGPEQADGTISGTVRGAANSSAIAGRTVEVVNVVNGRRQTATTNEAGGFTFKVAPGRYRVVLTLADGEVLLKQPSLIDVNRSDVDAFADFVVGIARAYRHRPARIRVDDGLGAPSA